MGPRELDLFPEQPPEPPKSPQAPKLSAKPPSAPSPAAEEREPAGLPAVITVTELTRRISACVSTLGRVSVEGEVSRVTRAASGHWYFDLKDADSKLACVLWKSQAASVLRFELKEGMQVVAHGKLDVFAPRGTYSLNVQRLEQAGLGALLARFEELKRELKTRGWFDRKRALPALPGLIGVVTSADGAAFQDFLRTRSLRWPGYPIRLAHTPVQGATCAAAIGRAIARLDQSGVDVIVVCRGGGSLEDLWGFNELAVAQAIWSSSVPVVSGVGHETDFTLADLVADFRAHTPTDAAQTVIPDRAALWEQLERCRNYLAQAIDAVLSERSETWARLASSRALRDPHSLVRDRAEQLLQWSERLASAGARRMEQSGARLGELHRRLERQSPRARLGICEQRAQRLALGLPALAKAAVEVREGKLQVLRAQLDALSPLAILARGYSITKLRGGREALKDAAGLLEGQELETRLNRGSVISTVRPSPSPPVSRPSDSGSASGSDAR
jgi:exodeoxyribonuclease VII large subunit